MRIATNVVKPGTAERLANARKRLAAGKRRGANSKGSKANPATTRTVAAAIMASQRARRNGRGIYG